MKLTAIAGDFSVCSIMSMDHADRAGDFVFLAKTDEEISLVCATDRVPPRAIKAEHGWKMLRVDGVLEFGMVGVIAELAGVMASEGIPVFMVSTFNTDYILVKGEYCNRALHALEQNGHAVSRG